MTQNRQLKNQTEKKESMTSKSKKNIISNQLLHYFIIIKTLKTKIAFLFTKNKQLKY